MKDYIDIANDKARVYEQALIFFVILGIIGGLFVSYNLAQTVVYGSSSVEYETSIIALIVYSIMSVVINVVLGLVMKFFIDMYKEMVMQSFMTHHILQVFEKAKIE